MSRHGQPRKPLPVRGTRKKQEPTHDNSRQRSKETINAGGVSAPPSQVDRCPHSASAIEQKNNETNESSTLPWLRWVNKFKPVLEGIGIFFAIGYAFVTYRQWRDAQANFVMDQRAWVQLSHAWPEQDHWPRMPFSVMIKMTNVGKAPIFDIETQSVIEFVDIKKAPSFDMSRPFYGHQGGLIFPTEDREMTVWWTDQKGSQRALFSAEISKLLNTEQYVAIFGSISYRDTFGQHWESFCRWKGYAQVPKVTANANPCVGWNTAGEGELPQKYRSRK